MFKYNEITEKRYIELEGVPYEVISSNVFRKQKRKPVNQTKLRNLLTGKVLEKSFHQNEKAKEADIDTKEVKYLYQNKGVYWFSNPDDPSNRFEVSEETIPDGFKFIKENSVIKSLVFDNEIIGFKIPIKVDLGVKEAPPAVRGNTAQAAGKKIILETGTEISAPIFINEGDTVIVNTETGEYAGRS